MTMMHESETPETINNPQSEKLTAKAIKCGKKVVAFAQRHRSGVLAMSAAVTFAAGSFTIKNEFDKRAAQSTDRAAETRMHDYGFPFDWSKQPFGKIDIRGGAKQADIRCGTREDEKVGFGFRNEAPDKISVTLAAPRDSYGNSVSADNTIGYPVGSPEDVERFLTDTLPAMCAGVKQAIDQRNN